MLLRFAGSNESQENAKELGTIEECKDTRTKKVQSKGQHPAQMSHKSLLNCWKDSVRREAFIILQCSWKDEVRILTGSNQ